MGRACYAWNEGSSCHQGTPSKKERYPDSEDNLQQLLQHKARERIETNIRWKRRKYTHNGGSAYRLLCPTHYSRCILSRIRNIDRRGRSELFHRVTVPSRLTVPQVLVLGRRITFKKDRDPKSTSLNSSHGK